MLRGTVSCMRIKSTLLLQSRYTHRVGGGGRNARGLSILRAVLFGRQCYLTVEAKTNSDTESDRPLICLLWIRSHINCLAVAENRYLIVLKNLSGGTSRFNQQTDSSCSIDSL